MTYLTHEERASVHAHEDAERARERAIVEWNKDARAAISGICAAGAFPSSVTAFMRAAVAGATASGDMPKGAEGLTALVGALEGEEPDVIARSITARAEMVADAMAELREERWKRKPAPAPAPASAAPAPVPAPAARRGPLMGVDGAGNQRRFRRTPQVGDLVLVLKAPPIGTMPPGPGRLLSIEENGTMLVEIGERLPDSNEVTTSVVVADEADVVRLVQNVGGATPLVAPAIGAT